MPFMPPLVSRAVRNLCALLRAGGLLGSPVLAIELASGLEFGLIVDDLLTALFIRAIVVPVERTDAPVKLRPGVG